MDHSNFRVPVLTVPDVWNALLQICASLTPLIQIVKKLFVVVCSGCYKNTIYQVVCKPQEFIPLSSRCWKSKIMVSAWSGSGAGPHLDYRLPTLRCALIYQNEGERVLEGLFHRTLIPSMRPLHSWSNHLPNSHLPIPSHGGVRISTHEFWENTEIEHSDLFGSHWHNRG